MTKMSELIMEQSLLLDFGKTITAYTCIEIECGGEGYIDIGYSEKLNHNGCVFSNLWSNDVCEIPDEMRPFAYGDKCIMRKGYQKWESYEWRAYRYVQLTVKKADAPVRIRSFHAIRSWYPLNMKGHFLCDDLRINKLWYIGLYTMRICMHENIMDCATRERAQWWGDAVNIQKASFYSFHDVALFVKGAKQIAFAQDADGRLHSPAPGALKWELPTQMMYYVIGMKDYYMYTGDKEFIKLLYQTMKEYIKYVIEKLDAKGLLNINNWSTEKTWIWIDWSPIDKKGQVAAINFFFIMAIDAMRYMAKELEEKDDCIFFDKMAREIRNKSQNVFWNQNMGAYADSYQKDTISQSVTEMTNAVAILSGVAKKEHIDKIIKNVFHNSKNTIRSSPYFKMFYYEALFSIGMGEMVLDDIEKSYLKFVDMGFSTIPELFPDQSVVTDSFTHAWSAVCNYILPAYIAGIRPLKPGFKEFIVNPCLYRLNSIQVKVPTPKGIIEAGFNKNNGVLSGYVHVPAGLNCILDSRLQQTIKVME